MAKKPAKKAKKPAKKAVKRPSKKAKKAPAKKAAKRPAKGAAKATKRKPTKRAKKKAARISLNLYDVQDVPEEQHFYFVNGQRVKNVKELAQIMDHLEQEVFDYHVNAERNDFYNWVRHVFQDIELAEKLVGVTGPKHLQFTIYKHVADKALKK